METQAENNNIPPCRKDKREETKLDCYLKVSRNRYLEKVQVALEAVVTRVETGVS